MTCNGKRSDHQLVRLPPMFVWPSSIGSLSTSTVKTISFGTYDDFLRRNDTLLPVFDVAENLDVFLVESKVICNEIW